MQFESTPAPTRSPWGAVQHAEEIAPGIWTAGTAGHGGIKLSRQRNAAMPPYMRISGGWYEEDSLWARVALVFKDLPYFTKPSEKTGRTAYDYAEETVRHWDPEIYEQFFGVTLTPERSRKKAEKAFHAETLDKFVVASAWGDWARFVPKDMVGVAARRSCDNAERWFLVPSAEYNASAPFGFVINQALHQEIEQPTSEMLGSR